MAEIRSVCVYCGSAPGADPAYADAATRFGTMLGERGIRLVYGGGKVGLMGAVAKAAKAAGGEVVGIIPKALATKEIANRDVDHLEVVDSMHARKARMAELADAFATLPGGLGTLEELFETWTWGQLGWHDKPIGFLNVGGFYDPLLALVEGMVGAGFIRPAHLGLVHVDADPEGLLGRMRAHVPPVVKRYIGAEDPVAVG